MELCAVAARISFGPGWVLPASSPKILTKIKHFEGPPSAVTRPGPKRLFSTEYDTLTKTRERS